MTGALHFDIVWFIFLLNLPEKKTLCTAAVGLRFSSQLNHRQPFRSPKLLNPRRQVKQWGCSTTGGQATTWYQSMYYRLWKWGWPWSTLNNLWWEVVDSWMCIFASYLKDLEKTFELMILRPKSQSHSKSLENYVCWPWHQGFLLKHFEPC